MAGISFDLDVNQTSSYLSFGIHNVQITSVDFELANNSSEEDNNAKIVFNFKNSEGATHKESFLFKGTTSDVLKENMEKFIANDKKYFPGQNTGLGSMIKIKELLTNSGIVSTANFNKTVLYENTKQFATLLNNVCKGKTLKIKIVPEVGTDGKNYAKLAKYNFADTATGTKLKISPAEKIAINAILAPTANISSANNAGNSKGNDDLPF